MNLSKNFTLAEFLKSETAKTFNVENAATEIHIKNMTYLCENTLEPLRTAIGPIIITSGYRSNALNVTMRKNGYYTSKTSQHMEGEAADIIAPGMTNKEIAKILLKLGIMFDQVIIESAERVVNGDIHRSEWLHISRREEWNRKQVLTMHNGRTI